MDFIEFSVNGLKCRVDDKIPRDTTLNSFIRNVLGLSGTKRMCLEGGCGSCIVSVKAPRQPLEEIETFAVNSCLVLVFSCHGWEVTTIEGLGDRQTGYSEVQKRITAFNGSQCGYCTPGWVMSLSSLLDQHLTMAELERSFGSNTCRCTGFRPIMDTIKSFAIDASPSLRAKVADIEDTPTCKTTNKPCQRKCTENSDDSDWSICGHAVRDIPQNTVELDFGKNKFFKVYDEEQIFEVFRREGIDDYMLVEGNTGKGIVESYEYPRILIDISDVKSLKEHLIDQNLVLGANFKLEDAKSLFKELASEYNEFAYLKKFADHLDLVAHIPVRKIGSIAGNLMMKKKVRTFQSDIFLLLASVKAIITIRDAYGTKTPLSVLDFLEYDMVGKLILNIELPPKSSSHVYQSYKIMPRNQNALAIVNAAFSVKINKKTNVFEDVTIVFGNIRTDFVYAIQTETYLKGKNVFNNQTLQAAINVLAKELVPEELTPEPAPEARKKLAIGLFYKFILSICPSGLVSSEFRSGGKLIERPISHGTQDFQKDPTLYPLNKPETKLEGQIQSAGEARYANDIPPLPREVFAAFVQSTVHRGEVDHIDAAEVLEIDGVIALYTAKDIPGKNSFTMPGLPLLTADEEILATKDILYYGQPIAVIVANTEVLAQKAAKEVKVIYKNVSSSKPVLRIDEAKKDSKRLIPSEEAIEPKGRGVAVKKIVKGVFEIGAQYHYYIEPLNCVVIPVDNGLEVHDSTQWIDLSQIAIAQSLGMNESDIHVKVRRVGGGFGGKITRSAQVSSACALVAKKLNKPCRFILPIQTNLTIAGRRLPCQTEYEVGVDDNGKIQYLEANIIEDQGCSNNEDILSYTIDSFPNCYNKDNWTVKSSNVLTDLPSNTFMRAPGALEGISTIEHIMEHIAFEVKKDSTEVRLANMREEDNDIPTLIKKLKSQSKYDKRSKEVNEFNKVNRWMKKAIKINVMLFPVVYYGNYSAFVSIYRGDGTVTVSTGGIEMGQGINTKAAQVCAYSLGIPLKCVSVLPHYSFVSANNIFSGSSITSESVCYSIIKACDILKKRLEPVKQKLDNPTWLEVIQQAGQDQVDMTAEYMMKDTEPDLSPYSAFAVNIIETQLDILTGRSEILRVDILEDVGLSANPQIDVGQVEGGYMQGVGYFTTEKFVYDLNTGRLLTNRSLNYHVPLALDIPIDFRIRLRYNSKNPKGVLSSKAVGEMGACTACGIMFAIRQCINESRNESGFDNTKWIHIDTPYDTASILKALDVKLEEMVLTEK